MVVIRVHNPGLNINDQQEGLSSPTDTYKGNLETTVLWQRGVLRLGCRVGGAGPQLVVGC